MPVPEWRSGVKTGEFFFRQTRDRSCLQNWFWLGMAVGERETSIGPRLT